MKFAVGNVICSVPFVVEIRGSRELKYLQVRPLMALAFSRFSTKSTEITKNERTNFLGKLGHTELRHTCVPFSSDGVGAKKDIVWHRGR